MRPLAIDEDEALDARELHGGKGRAAPSLRTVSTRNNVSPILIDEKKGNRDLGTVMHRTNAQNFPFHDNVQLSPRAK